MLRRTMVLANARTAVHNACMSIARNSIYNITGTLVPAVVSVLLVPVYISLIGAERYGTLAIAWLLLGFFSQADFGMGRAVTRAVADRRDKDPTERAAIVWSGLAVVSGVGLASAAAVFLLGGFFFSGPFKVEGEIRSEMLDALWMLAACNLVVALSGVVTGGLRGLERFALVSFSNMFSMVAVQVLPLIAAVWLGSSMYNLVGAALLGRVLGLIVQCAGAWWHLLKGFAVKIDRKEISGLAAFGKWIFLSSLLGPLMIMADRFLIGAILGAVAVAAYTIPMQIVDRIKLFPLEMVNALFPRFAWESDQAALARCRQYTALVGQLFAPLVVGLICLAGPLLTLWLGDELDTRSILVGQIILVGAWFNALANVPYSYIQARGNSRFTALLHLAELPAYAAALAAFAWAFGLPGFALAFSLRCAVDCGFLLGKAGMFDRTLLTRVSGPLLLMALALVVANLGLDWIALLGLACLLGSIATLWLVWQMPPELWARVLSLPVVGKLARVLS